MTTPAFAFARRCRSMAVAVLLGVLSLAAPLRAEGEPESLMVLVRLDESVPAEWEQQAIAAARDTVSTTGRFTWQAPPEVSLRESRTLVGCERLDESCAAKIGETLQVDHVLYVEVVRPIQQRPVLTLLPVGVDDPNANPAVSVELPDASANGARVLDLYIRQVVAGTPPAAVLVDDGSRLASSTAIAVSASFAGTTISVDGQRLGPAPQVLDLALEPGTHRVTLEREGFAPATNQVKVMPGQVLALSLAAPTEELSSATPTASADYPRWDSPYTWVGLGIGAAALAASGAFYGLYTSTAQELAALDDEAVVGSMTQVEHQAADERAEIYYLFAVTSGAVGGLLAAAGLAVLLYPPME